MPTAQDPYDELPYTSRAFAATHPANLATLGHLFALDVAPPQRCRVLEIGCAGGGNLVPMAVSLPDASFVGLDLNAKSVRAAQARAADLSAPNATFLTADIATAQDLGTFDYIVCHGVYSWVSPETQRALLQAVRRHLAPAGVAFVSYNTLPGWSHRSALRHMGLFHAGAHPDLTTRLAQTRALVGLLQRATPEGTPLRDLLNDEVRHFSMPDWYIAHEHLGEHNEALWFHEFVARAGDADLQFLAEADLADMVPTDLSDDLRAEVEALGTDLLRLEQYLDFVRNRTFRRTLLCHSDVVPNRDIALTRAHALHFSGALAAAPVDADAGPTVPVPQPPATDPLAAATWAALSDATPDTLSFDALATAVVSRTGATDADAREAAAWQVLGGLSRRAVYASLLPLHTTSAAQPEVWSVAQYEVAHGESWVTNRRHQGIQLDPYMVALVPLLDGHQDPERVIATLADQVAGGTLALLDLDGNPVTARHHALTVLREGLPRAIEVLRYYALLT